MARLDQQGANVTRSGGAGAARRPTGARTRPRRDRADHPLVRLDRTPPTRAEAPTLDAQQQAVVDHRDGHLLVLAGPGTGKTTTLVELVVDRLRPGARQLDAGSILALTFGRRAARELSDRIARRLAGGPVPVVSTFHSFAYGVLRQHADPVAFASPPRLLTAAEQEARLRELLTWSIREGRLEWPDSLSGAVGTRGIAEQVRALLARARGQGLDGAALAAFGRRHGVPVWTAVGRFFQEYLDTLGFEGSLDYAELIHQAVALASKEREGRALRETYQLIVVDEYQDTDPAQVRLLHELARGGAQVVAVGDPDQAIYGFRGADVGGILEFPRRFGSPTTGAPAAIEVLRTTRRFTAPIADAAHRVLGATPLPGLPAEVQRRHRTPVTADGLARVEARTYPSASAEASGVVETLLRAHAGLDGEAGAAVSAGSPAPLAWSQMAVLVRKPAVSGPVLVRAMRAAGIPIAVPPDEVALADEPAVQTLLAVLSLAIDPGSVPEDTGRLLLSGPLGRVDPVAIRALARSALVEHRHSRAGEAEPGSGIGSQAADAGGGTGGADPAHRTPPAVAVAARQASPEVAGLVDFADAGPSGPSSDVLLTRALAAGTLPRSGAAIPGAVRAGFERIAHAVAEARRAVDRGDQVSEALWAAWDATDWPERLRRAALGSGPGGAGADRDLDALVSLFDLANRLPAQRRGRVGLEGFLAEVRALRLSTETRVGPETERDHVRLLSAHRAKGLEWDMVVVAAVQEGQWPDLRLRSDLLHVAELGQQGRLDHRSYADLLAEERRLMYVACTRARSALVVTAVAEPFEGGMQPSRFLADLGVPIRSAATRPEVPLAGPGLITALRSAATAEPSRGPDGTPDPDVEALRGAAIARLAALSSLAGDQPLAGLVGPLAAAQPSRWWDVRPVTVPDGPGAISAAAAPDEPGVAGPNAALPASDDATPAEAGSSEPARVDPAISAPPPELPTVRLSPSSVEALRTCPLRWFLERKVRAGTPSGAQASVGMVVHAVAEALVRGEVEPDHAAIAAFVDEIWERMPFAARYHSALERQRVHEMIASLLMWQAESDRTAIGAETSFTFTLPSHEGPVAVSGTIDRIDRAPDGRIHLVDFKTGRSAQTRAAADQNPQLGVYQLAVREGAVAGLIDAREDAGSSARSGDGPEPAAAEGAVPDGADPNGADPNGTDRDGADPNGTDRDGAAGPEPPGVSSGPRLGGAELVNLGARLSSGMPTVRFQAPLPEGRTWVHEVIDDAARLARGPRYPARRNDRCSSCAFLHMCPAQRSPSGGAR